jgi:hypothetical protein
LLLLLLRWHNGAGCSFQLFERRKEGSLRASIVKDTMRIRLPLLATVAAAPVLLLAHTAVYTQNGCVKAFVVHTANHAQQHRARVAAAAKEDSAGRSCDSTRLWMSSSTTSTPATPAVIVEKGAGKILRTVRLTDVNGNQIILGDKMSTTTTATSSNNKPSVVVFLRHLG